MATFTMDIKKLNVLQKKFVNVAEEFKLYAIKELDAAVLKMESEAKNKASQSKLPRLNPASTYQRTGKLMNSIYSTPYSNGRATIAMGKGINYAPYVEFGTGNGYSLPYKSTPQFKWKVDGIAHTFLRSTSRNYNMPARPFFFNTVNLNLNALFRKLNKFH